MAGYDNRRFKLALSATLLLLVVLALAAPVAFVAAEDMVPTITVDIDDADAYQEVKVFYAGTTAVLNGEVTVTDAMPGDTVKIAIDGTPWDEDVEPQTFTVGAAREPHSFTVRVPVPVGQREDTYSGEVQAVWVSSTGDVTVTGTDTFRVKVRSIPFNLFADQDYMLAAPGDTKRVTVTILDESVSGLVYLCLVDDPVAPGAGDWLERATAWLDTERIQLDAGDSGTFVLEVVVPVDATSATMGVQLTVQAEDQPRFVRELDITVQVVTAPVPPPVDPAEPWLPIDPMLLLYLMVALVAIGFVGFFGFTEVGMLALMWGLLVPLFTRLKHKEVLNQFTRGEIYGFIQANPGVHLTAIKENLGLANGVLAYHLKVLIREEFIVTRREGGFKRFYPRDMRVPRKRVHFTRLQLDIVEKLSMHPGSSQASLARMLDESKQVINYNIGVLVAAEVVHVVREGSRTRLYVKDATRLKPQVAELVEEGDAEEERASQTTPAPVRWQ